MNIHGYPEPWWWLLLYRDCGWRRGWHWCARLGNRLYRLRYGHHAPSFPFDYMRTTTLHGLSGDAAPNWAAIDGPESPTRSPGDDRR